MAVSVVVGTEEVGLEEVDLEEVGLVEVGTECKKCSSVLSVVWLVKRVHIIQVVRLSVQRDCMMSTFGNVGNVPLSKKVHQHLGVVDVAEYLKEEGHVVLLQL